VKAVIAKSFARIHKANLINFGILPLEFADPADYDRIGQGERITIKGVRDNLSGGRLTMARAEGKIELKHDLSERQADIIRAGGLLNWVRENPPA
jgi:aconitate hydratase